MHGGKHQKMDKFASVLSTPSALLEACSIFFDLYRKAAQVPSTHFTGRSLTDRDPAVVQRMMSVWDFFYHCYFQMTTDGWQHIPDTEPLLLVGSHNGGLAAPDMFMMMYDWFRRFGIERPVYGLMHPKVWQVYPALGRLAAQGGAVRAHPKMAIAALRQNASVLVYPGGPQDVFRPYSQRHDIHLHGRRGFIKLALQEATTIVPLVSLGAHDSLVVVGDLYPLLKALHGWGVPWFLGFDPEIWPIYLGLPWGLAVGPLLNIPLPVKMHTRVCEPIRFERYGPAAAKDAVYVEHCYETVRTAMQAALNDLVQCQGKH